VDEVERLAKLAGVELHGLAHARARSDGEIGRIRDQFAQVSVPADACVAIMGSLGRREMTSGSDVDYAVLTTGSDVEPRVREEVAAVLAEMGCAPPNSAGPFAQVVSTSELVERIGSDSDSNTNMTRRLLIALESVPVAGDEAWKVARATILDRYLSASQKPHAPPRFFLNDVIRYWRTLGVDYEGKMGVRQGEGWATRNAKLRLSRKMLFAGGLVPLLECSRFGSEEMKGFLADRFAQAPADRVAAAFLHYEAADVGGRTLFAYSQFLDLLDDGDRRRELEDLPEQDRSSSPLWRQVKALGAAFQRGLDSLLFDTALRSTVREYVVF
jgi:putative nucleotidyltransferase DUF294